MANGKYAETLHRLLDERDLSVRGFARLLAGEDATPEEVETQRSTAMRWLSDTTPTRKSRVKIAKALGVRLEDLEPTEASGSGEESIPALLRELAESLTALQIGQTAILEALGVQVGDGESRPIPPRHLSRQPRRTH